MRHKRWSPPAKDDVSRYAVGDPTYRVYASWDEVPQARRSGLRRRAVEEATLAYESEGPTEAAAILRRAWALDHDTSWRLLMLIDLDSKTRTQRTHILVLRECWAEAFHTGHRHPIGGRLFEHTPAATATGSATPADRLAHVKRLGQWREWRSRVVQWLITYRPTWSLSERRTMGAVSWLDPHLPKPKVTMDLVAFEAHLASMWPGDDSPTVHEAQEMLYRARAYTRRDTEKDVELLQHLRDPLVQRPETPVRFLSEWSGAVRVPVGSHETAQPKYGYRAILIHEETTPVAQGSVAQSIALARLAKLKKLSLLRRVGT